MTSVFCNRPFIEVSNQIDRGYTPCCWFETNNIDSSPQDTLPIDMFSSDLYNEIRKDMLANEKTEFLQSHCGSCFKREETTGFSPRLLFQDFPHQLREMFEDDGTYKGGDYRHLNLALNIFGNYCNLECYECIPKNSSSRTIAVKKLNDKWSQMNHDDSLKIKEESNSDLKRVDPEWFHQIVSNILDHAHVIEELSFCGGEPALMKSHFEILDALVLSGHSEHINLDYVSNMTVMNLSVLKKYIDQFKSVSIQWSVDGLKTENSWLRYPTDWDQMMINVREVKKYLQKTGKGRLRATMTPSLFGILGFSKLCKWLYLGGFISSLNNLDIVNDVNDTILHQRHLPVEVKEQISDEIQKLSPSLYEALWMKRDEDKFQLALQYATELDETRGTNWKEVFPSLVPYIKL